LAYFTFTGREWDAECSLYHYRARTYSPMLGRFLTRDPLGYVDGMNLYEYVKGRPVHFVDFSGRKLTEFTQDVDAMPVLAEKPNAINKLGSDLGVTHSTWDKTIAVIGYPIGKTLLVTPIKSYVEIKGSLTIKMYRNIDLVPNPDKPSWGGITTEQHERKHGKIWKVWWNGLKKEVDVLEKWWSCDCAELAVALANTSSLYYEWRASRDQVYFHQELGIPLTKKEKDTLNDLTKESDYLTSWSNFTKAKCK
jgi:RHS repeat-associated protein